MSRHLLSFSPVGSMWGFGFASPPPVPQGDPHQLQSYSLAQVFIADGVRPVDLKDLIQVLMSITGLKMVLKILIVMLVVRFVHCLFMLLNQHLLHPTCRRCCQGTWSSPSPLALLLLTLWGPHWLFWPVFPLLVLRPKCLHMMVISVVGDGDYGLLKHMEAMEVC